MTSLASRWSNELNKPSTAKEIELELITITVLGSLVLLDVAALRRGSDSRESIGDDWHRSTIV